MINSWNFAKLLQRRSAFRGSIKQNTIIYCFYES